MHSLVFKKMAAGLAGHAAEVAGLGILAAPHAYNAITGKKASHKTERNTELAGLGVLAAPSIHAIGKHLMKRAMVEAFSDELAKIADAMLTPTALRMVRGAVGQVAHAQPQTGRALHMLGGTAKVAPAATAAAAPAKKVFDLAAYRTAKANQGAYRGFGQNRAAVV
jgi:hypothetical protein